MAVTTDGAVDRLLKVLKVRPSLMMATGKHLKLMAHKCAPVVT